MDLIVTADELMEAARCASRMTGYADPDERLIITCLTADNGTQIRLILDRSCLKKNIVPDDSS
ncbi:hypothetical protein [Caproicibacter fermentans]|uniref:Uncharacterized protein n=1 Tax=Caproicibacter fermentans TaxID=2576756 RepID=A0A7G8TD49_9FIRM|nr:hypothetical protein [Caproicibacter fermentans]QNK41540.1 hypothetical protein HCR03_04560 [Caproicibacter fermentans]